MFSFLHEQALRSLNLGSIAVFGLLCLTSLAKPPLVPSSVSPNFAPHQTAVANLQWNVPDRFGPKTQKGLVDYHWNRVNQTYDPRYVNPSSWLVNFNACASSGGASAISSFSIEVNGATIPKGNNCRFAHSFPSLGSFDVRLNVLTTDGLVASTQTTITIKDYLIVSIGDSYASGEGNPDVPLGLAKPVWIDKVAHRSAYAGPAQAAMLLEQQDPKTSVTFVSFACSGASIDQGLLGGYKNLAPQLNKVAEAVSGRTIDALIVSVGGNDIGFSDLVKKAIRLRDCSKDKKTNALLQAGLLRLPALYEKLAQALSALPTVSHIFITEYPDIVHKGTSEFCDHAPPIPDLLNGISQKEAQWAAERVITPLNDLIRAAAELHQWIYVGRVSLGFLTHGYCAKEERWVRTFNDSWKVQASYFGTAHPNVKGHQWYARRLLEEMQRQGIGN